MAEITVSASEWNDQLDRLYAQQRLGGPRYLVPAPGQRSYGTQTSTKEAELSFNAPFAGEHALDGLLEVLNSLAEASTEGSPRLPSDSLYARILPCVQSSGTGKSRLFHEAAAVVFTLPICWRTVGGSGYPLRDESVSEAFRNHRSRKKVRENVFWEAFLTALLLETTSCIDAGKLTDSPEQWREFFTKGMTNIGHNRSRIAFFDAVINTADWLITSAEPDSHDPWLSFRLAGQSWTLPLAALVLSRKLQFTERPPCRLNIVFDEAHLAFAPSLSDNNAVADSTLFTSFRKAARLLRKVPFTFSLLSTSSSVREYVPTPSRSSGWGPSYAPPPPLFALVGWDQCLHLTDPDTNSVNDGDEFSRMVHYGRPLFGTMYMYLAEYMSPEEKEYEVIDLATYKLIGAPEELYSYILQEEQVLALLGSLLPISPSSAYRPPPIACDIQAEQVRHHLAILDNFYSHAENMCVVRPSEPVLAIAAGRRLHFEISLIFILKQLSLILNMPRDERGEMVAMLFLIGAQHRASVPKTTLSPKTLERSFPYRASDLFKSVFLVDYLQRLLALSDESQHMIAQFSSAGRVRVCQFIAREQNSLPDPGDLSAAYERGCAFECCFNQTPELIVPLVFELGEPGALIVKVDSKGDAGPSRRQEAMLGLRDIRAEMFSGVQKPRCVLIFLSLAATPAAESGFLPLEVCSSPDDPSLLHIFVNGLEALSLLQQTDSAGELLPFNIGDRENVKSFLGQRDAVTDHNAHQKSVRQTMNPLTGGAPGHRQFYATIDEHRPSTSTAVSSTVDDVEMEPSEAPNVILSGSKKRKGPDEPSSESSTEAGD